MWRLLLRLFRTKGAADRARADAFGYRRDTRGSSFGPTAYRKSCELGKLYRKIAERHHCGFIDCAELDFEINTVDGLHYSRADHTKLAPVVAGKIRAMLD